MAFPNVLRIGVMPLRNVVELKTDTRENVTFTGGIEANAIKVLAEVIGFDYKLIIPPDKEWGRHPRGKRWTGLIGMVERNETDIAIGDLTITKQRLRAVDFIPYTVEDNTFATRLPKTIALHGSYVHPFQLEAWLATISVVLLLPLFFKLFMKKKISISGLYTVMMGSMLNQPLPFAVKWSTDKLLLGSWLLFAFFLSSSYTALLLSSLTFPMLENNVRDIAGLTKVISEGSFKCMAHRGSVKIDMLTSSQNEALQIIGRNIIEKDWLSSLNTVVMPNDIEENVAVLGPRWLFLLEYGEEPFTTKYLFKESFAFYSVGIAVHKRFCCKKELSKYISRMISSGIFHGLYTKQLLMARRRLGSEYAKRNRTDALTMRDLVGAFLLLLGGWAIGFLIWLIRFSIWYVKHPK